MNEAPEMHPLLQKPRFPDSEGNSSGDGDWSDGCSSCTDSGSSEAEWEGLVEPSGELLYIDCHPQVFQAQKDEKRDTLTRNPTRRSSKGKLSRLMKRRESKRASTRSYTDAYAVSETPNKVTFLDYQEGEIRDVLIRVDPSNRAKYGRRVTLVEALLGINITSFSDGVRIMVSGFLPEQDLVKSRGIKIGDWLKSIDDFEVNFQNINAYLEGITHAQNVRMRLQRIGAVEITKNPPVYELSNQSEFVRRLTTPNQTDDATLNDSLHQFPASIICINTANTSETDSIPYTYPKPASKNFLAQSRGIFLTLNHLLPELRISPELTTIRTNQNAAHVSYVTQNNMLLLLSLPATRVTPTIALSHAQHLLRTLSFTYQTLHKCFQPANEKQLDRFFARYFSRVITGEATPQEMTLSPAPAQFEDSLPAAHFVYLPREAQMQLDDALNELEASDYRDWNEDPLNCQRLFTIIGSAFYHDGYLLASHLQREDLVDVHCYCRQQGILHLSRTEPIRTLVLWREVFPSSCNRGFPDDESVYRKPMGRWFLLVVGNAKDMLTVLMEAGGCTSPSEENQGPDVFYVEEAQETLKHIQNMGISALADKWLSLNSRPQIATADFSVNKHNKKIDFLGNIGFIKSSSPIPPKAPSPASKRPEVTSILKNRPERSLNKSNVNLSGSSSLFSSEDVSEDSVSQEARSEVSDEPVIGRRATREKNLESDDSDSDWEDYRPNSETSGNFDLSDLKQLSELIPSRLTSADDNVLYHYVHFDATEGIIICPTSHDNTPLTDEILTNFRNSCQSIHNLFRNTIRFKTMLSQDMAKLVVNKSLIAIKEHGILFECTIEENGKKVQSLSYWVIGRLFYNPHPREFYVCYRDSAPQNLVEMAFRLGMTSAG